MLYFKTNQEQKNKGLDWLAFMKFVPGVHYIQETLGDVLPHDSTSYWITSTKTLVAMCEVGYKKKSNLLIYMIIIISYNMVCYSHYLK